jgi:hypothetical protein
MTFYFTVVVMFYINHTCNVNVAAAIAQMHSVRMSPWAVYRFEEHSSDGV